MKKENLKLKITNLLKEVMDPELHVDIVSLGLIYDVDLDSTGVCQITMTLTTPGCPLMPIMEAMIRSKLKTLAQIKEVKIIVTFDPPWDASKMSEETRTALGF